MSIERPATVADLRASGFPDRSVKDEVRDNLVARLREGRSIVSGIVGYDRTVVPALERALLAGHDLILLGERGQAKTRLVRGLVDLLDPEVPVVPDCEIRCHPLRPVCVVCRELAAEHGEGLPVAWLGRDHRFAEKLATPDISVADLIGDVDPIRVAEGRYLADERTIHYGLVPRTNRGIVAVNELPDLPERIQVALLNVLEERDVQIRGYLLRLPLDIMLVATANPDDYTNRGRIISPLKDRFGAQVRTHYPAERADEIKIVDAEATPPPTSIAVRTPRWVDEVLAELAAQLRATAEVNQRSGVSVRYTIGAHETVVASAVRRAAMAGESQAVPRIVDIWPVVPTALGRVEFDLLEEGREEEIVGRCLQRAILGVWRERLGMQDLTGLVERFDDGLQVSVGDTMPGEDLLGQFGERIDGLGGWMQALDLDGEDLSAAASAVEFVLEGLHLARLVNKDPLAEPTAGVYRA